MNTEKEEKEMKPVKPLEVHALESWRCRSCGYMYEEKEYILPIMECPSCGSRHSFEKVTEDFQFHPGDDLMLLP